TAAVKLVRSGPGLDLNLSAATAHFRIDGRKDHLHFTNKVGMKFRRRVDAGRPALPADGDAVPLDIDVPGTDSCKLCLVGSKYGTDCRVDPRHDLRQIEHIVARQWKVADFRFVKHV